jgi:hypothetical protein
MQALWTTGKEVHGTFLFGYKKLFLNQGVQETGKNNMHAYCNAWIGTGWSKKNNQVFWLRSVKLLVQLEIPSAVMAGPYFRYKWKVSAFQMKIISPTIQNVEKGAIKWSPVPLSRSLGNPMYIGLS